MSARRPRFVIVHTDAGFHVSIRARNGLKVFATEVYASERAARRAINIARAAAANYAMDGPAPVIDERGRA